MMIKLGRTCKTTGFASEPESIGKMPVALL